MNGKAPKTNKKGAKKSKKRRSEKSEEERLICYDLDLFYGSAEMYNDVRFLDNGYVYLV